MTPEQAEVIVRREWDVQGACRSCGWHGGLSEYSLPEQLTIDEDRKCIELPCLSDDEESIGHRGVRIYWRDSDSA